MKGGKIHKLIGITLVLIAIGACSNKTSSPQDPPVTNTGTPPPSPLASTKNTPILLGVKPTEVSEGNTFNLYTNDSCSKNKCTVLVGAFSKGDYTQNILADIISNSSSMPPNQTSSGNPQTQNPSVEIILPAPLVREACSDKIDSCTAPVSVKNSEGTSNTINIILSAKKPNETPPVVQVECDKDKPCPDGSMCNMKNQCIPKSCGHDLDCGIGMLCASGACISASGDAADPCLQAMLKGKASVDICGEKDSETIGKFCEIYPNNPICKGDKAGSSNGGSDNGSSGFPGTGGNPCANGICPDKPYGIEWQYWCQGGNDACDPRVMVMDNSSLIQPVDAKVSKVQATTPADTPNDKTPNTEVQEGSRIMPMEPSVFYSKKEGWMAYDLKMNTYVRFDSKRNGFARHTKEGVKELNPERGGWVDMSTQDAKEVIFVSSDTGKLYQFDQSSQLKEMTPKQSSDADKTKEERSMQQRSSDKKP